MLKLIKNHQAWGVHKSEIEFNRRILSLMGSLTTRAKVIQQLHLIKIRIMKYNKNYKYRAVCRLTGRARASTQRFGLTRIGVRKYGHDGFAPGFTKASW